MKGEIDWIVKKALEKDRPRRYDTAKGLSQEQASQPQNGPVTFCRQQCRSP